MMRIQSIRHISNRQQGIALFIALIFLVILTLISVTAMRSSTMELYMATNDQAHRTGIDSTQSAADIVINSQNAIRVTSAGDTSCFGFGNAPSGCTFNTNFSNPAAGVSSDNFVRVTMEGVSSCPRGLASSANAGPNTTVTGAGAGSSSTLGSCAYFQIESQYDATAKRGGRSNTVQGYVIKMAQQ